MMLTAMVPATVHGGATVTAQYRCDNGFSVSSAVAYNNSRGK